MRAPAAFVMRWRASFVRRKTVTRDLGGTANTAQFTDAIIARLA